MNAWTDQVAREEFYEDDECDEYDDYVPPFEGNIRCGKCQGRHFVADQVRACYAGNACTWAIVIGRDEDGQEVIRDCGFPVTTTERGHLCSAGHSHVYAEYRSAERWDYAEDRGEAEILEKYGTQARDLVTGGPFRWDA